MSNQTRGEINHIRRNQNNVCTNAFPIFHARKPRDRQQVKEVIDLCKRTQLLDHFERWDRFRVKKQAFVDFFVGVKKMRVRASQFRALMLAHKYLREIRREAKRLKDKRRVQERVAHAAVTLLTLAKRSLRQRRRDTGQG